MENPRPEKVALVAEVGERLDAAEAVVLTEYRGIDVGGMADLRRALREAGGTYKIYKNTLVRLAAAERGIEIDDLLTGPTAIAFVDGDVAGVAKALRDFARTNPALVVKGGLLGGAVVGSAEVTRLADLPSREVLLSEIAGLFAAPMQQMAGLLDAVPRSFAYALNALIEAGGAPDAPAAPAEAAADTPPAEDSATDPTPADAGTETPADTAETEES
ncbi:50S ribosomal protein L10 [Iamia majanohamensis]|uniref:Large ribosomal subunit protein uL10 n=1 Tax=Iamia majanohamensis TaxID=467976 RepID=A0AAE9Y8Y7_9ACTN|nr:50S ribosomal protein L10 [Iamia majanohamensis]WCO66688.1 50S ribosomal protein L10 [Iamia majanohamensis]